MNRVFHRPLAIMALTAVMIGGIAFLPLAAQPKAAAQAQDEEPTRRTVLVTGTGSANVEPDRAIVSLGVQTDAETASAALEENNQQMQSLLTALRGAGVANADIRTRTVQLYPRYDIPPTPPTTNQENTQPGVTGYTATNTVDVTVRDLDNLGDLIDQAVEAGSNQIQGIQFDVSDQRAALDQARESAFEDASNKAQQLARLANGSLGQVLNLSETSSFPLPYAGGIMFDRAESAVPISPGTQPINVTLQVTWELE